MMSQSTQSLSEMLDSALKRRSWKYRLRSASTKVAVYAIIMAVLFATDKTVVAFVASEMQPILDMPVCIWLLGVGRGYVTTSGLFIIGLMVLLMDRKAIRRLVVALALLGVTTAVTEIGKVSVGRVRPQALIVGHESGRMVRECHVGERSFPSGHATGAFCLYAVFGRFYPKASPLLLLLAVGCGISRVLMLKHFPSDVFAGALIGYYLSKSLLPPEVVKWATADRAGQKGPTAGDEKTA